MLKTASYCMHSERNFCFRFQYVKLENPNMIALTYIQSRDFFCIILALYVTLKFVKVRQSEIFHRENIMNVLFVKERML